MRAVVQASEEMETVFSSVVRGPILDRLGAASRELHTWQSKTSDVREVLAFALRLAGVLAKDAAGPVQSVVTGALKLVDLAGRGDSLLTSAYVQWFQLLQCTTPSTRDCRQGVGPGLEP